MDEITGNLLSTSTDFTVPWVFSFAIFSQIDTFLWLIAVWEIC